MTDIETKTPQSPTTAISPATTSHEAVDPNDILNYKLPDPTFILNERQDKYLKAVKTMQAYAEGHRTVALASMKQLENMNTSVVSDLPNFESINEADNAVSGSQVHQDVAEGGNGASMNSFFVELRRNLGSSYSAAVELENKISTNVLPDLKAAEVEIEKRSKEVSTTTAAANKEFNKCIKDTTESNNDLNASINAVKVKGKVDYKKDPFLVKRTLLRKAALQIHTSNNRVDLMEKLEKNCKDLESYVIGVLKKAFNELTSILSNYYGTTINSLREINASLDKVDPEVSWGAFYQKNRKLLLETPPETDGASLNKGLEDLNLNPLVSKGNPLKRDFKDVVFNNQNNVLTSPVLEGILHQREGMLRKEYKSIYVVITPAGYLFGFPSKTVDSVDPNLVVYLPDAELKDESGSGKFIFKLKGKDHSNLVLRTSKNFRFKASSQDDFVTWINVLKAKVGSTNTGPFSASPSDVEE